MARLTLWILLTPLLALSFASRAGEPTRVSEAAALFDAYCLNRWVTFADLDRLASEGHYEVILDREIPLPNGQEMRQKNWLVPSKQGAPVLLTSSDGTNGPLHVVGCGIYVPDLDGEVLEAALSKLPRLGRPTKHTQVPEGATVAWWNARVGDMPPTDDSQVMLSRGVPDMPGVSVNLILKNHMNDPQAK